jgi:hypothetical protein
MKIAEKRLLLKLIRRAEEAMGAGNTDFRLKDSPANRRLVKEMRCKSSERGFDSREAEPDEDGYLWVTDWRLLHHLANKFAEELEE